MPREGRRHDHRPDSRDVKNQERLHATRHARHRRSGNDNTRHIDNSKIATSNPIRRRYARREGKLHDYDRRHGKRDESGRGNGRAPSADSAGGVAWIRLGRATADTSSQLRSTAIDYRRRHIDDVQDDKEDCIRRVLGYGQITRLLQENTNTASRGDTERENRH